MNKVDEAETRSPIHGFWPLEQTLQHVNQCLIEQNIYLLKEVCVIHTVREEPHRRDAQHLRFITQLQTMVIQNDFENFSGQFWSCRFIWAPAEVQGIAALSTTFEINYQSVNCGNRRRKVSKNWV